MLVNLRGERFSGRDGFRLVGILDDRDLTLAFLGESGRIAVQAAHRAQVAVHQRKAVQPLRYGRFIGIRIDDHIVGVQFIGEPDLPRPDDPPGCIAERDNGIRRYDMIARRKFDGGAVVLHIRNLADALLPKHAGRHAARQSRRSDLGTVIIGESGTVGNPRIAVPHHPGIETVGTGRMDQVGVGRTVSRKVGGGLHTIFFQGIEIRKHHHVDIGGTFAARLPEHDPIGSRGFPESILGFRLAALVFEIHLALGDSDTFDGRRLGFVGAKVNKLFVVGLLTDSSRSDIEGVILPDGTRRKAQGELIDGSRFQVRRLAGRKFERAFGRAARNRKIHSCKFRRKHDRTGLIALAFLHRESLAEIQGHTITGRCPHIDRRSRRVEFVGTGKPLAGPGPDGGQRERFQHEIAGGRKFQIQQRQCGKELQFDVLFSGRLLHDSQRTADHVFLDPVAHELCFGQFERQSRRIGFRRFRQRPGGGYRIKDMRPAAVLPFLFG